MIFSMTGFGQAQAQKNGTRVVVTIRSVNHKYLETQFHIPSELAYFETFFRERTVKDIKRGRLTFSLAVLNSDAVEEVVLNQRLAEEYSRVLESTRKKLKLKEGPALRDLISLPGVISYKKKDIPADDRDKIIKKVFEAALIKLLAMRRREGFALAADLKTHTRGILKQMASIKKLVKNSFNEKKKCMAIEEFESFLRSTDVSEEVARIDFHLKSFARHLTDKGPKGKVLDFIGQELQREINTLGAKIQDKDAAYHAVLVKDCIEKIREQVQNVE